MVASGKMKRSLRRCFSLRRLSPFSAASCSVACLSSDAASSFVAGLSLPLLPASSPLNGNNIRVPPDLFVGLKSSVLMSHYRDQTIRASLKEQKLKEANMHIYVRRGGPNYQRGLAKMRALVDEIGIPIEVYGPEATITGSLEEWGCDGPNSKLFTTISWHLFFINLRSQKNACI